MEPNVTRQRPQENEALSYPAAGIVAGSMNVEQWV